MRLHRFYIKQPLGEEVVVDEIAKIGQWTKVFRYKPNDTIILFNGDGFDGEYLITDISSKECMLRRTKRFPSYTPEKKTTLYMSLIKKDLFELVVQKATEIGISTIVPVVSERSLEKNLNFERLKSITIEASEQCGRGDIPTILETMPLSEAIKNSKSSDCLILLQKDGVDFRTMLSRDALNGKKDISIFIGPEGGWNASEIKGFSRAAAVSVSLGKTTLRAETAAIVASALVVQ